MLLERLNPAPELRPAYNLGCLFDIPTGKYFIGAHGESIHSGGCTFVTGVAGVGNSFKTAISDWHVLRVLDRYSSSNASVYDTELTKNIMRYYELAARFPSLAGRYLQDEGKLVLSDNAEKTGYTGNQYYDIIKSLLTDKAKDAKNIRTMPFLTLKDRKPIQTFFPTVSFIDSLSQFKTDSVIKMQDKADIGESERNMEAMRDGSAKTQMMIELGRIAASASGLFILTAHVGTDYILDPYTPPKKKLAFLKNGLKLKNVPEKFTFLTNNCWFVTDTKPLINQLTKAPEFPRNSDDDMRGDTDLMVLTLGSIRCKSGPTGIPFELIVSQSEGLLPGLSEFYYVKERGRYGLGGNDKNYFMELLPEVSLSRTTVRNKIDHNAALQRAITITSEMLQIEEYYHQLPRDLICSPKQLYEDINAKGYDWARLLKTRGYWIFEEDVDDNTLPFLSTMDLLNMRAGTYHPYWYGDLK